MTRLTRHQRRDRRARARSTYLEGVRKGEIQPPPPSPLFTEIQQRCFVQGLSRRVTRLVQQRALVQRLLERRFGGRR